MSAKAVKAGHRHDWQQIRVSLEQKGGRVTGLAVVWQCSGRKCAAETLTRLSIRKPAPNAKPAADAWLTGLARRDGKAAARKRLETQGRVADLENAPDLDCLDDLEFEPQPARRRNSGDSVPATPEDLARWHGFISGGRFLPDGQPAGV